MEKSDFSAKRIVIDAIDAKTPSPEIRAKQVYSQISPLLPQITDWDLLCFCVHYIGWITQRFPFIEVPAKELNSLLYTAHYYDRESDGDKSESRVSSDSKRESIPQQDGSNGASGEP